MHGEHVVQSAFLNDACEQGRQGFQDRFVRGDI